MKSLAINKELQKVYQKMAETLTQRCSGCGTYNKLTHSHLIPRSHSKTHITDINNIRYHCFSCHLKWERGKVAHEMTDFQRNMQYIKSVDEHYYNMRVSILDKNSAFFLGDYQV